MQKSAIPAKIPLPFANNAGVGYKNQIPTNSQIGIKNGAASYTDGFPPLCFVPVDSGGVPPFGADFNGVFNQATAGLQWLQAGGPLIWDSTFSAEIGGYPQGAVVASPSYSGLNWISLVDDNTTDPDTDSGSHWAPFNRWRLSSPLTLYVNASAGDDNNNGLSSGTPWATLQKSIDWIANNIDLNGNSVTVSCTGTFRSGVYNSKPWVGGGFDKVILSFTSGSQVNVTLGACFQAIGSNTGYSVTTASGTRLIMTATGTGGEQGSCIIASNDAEIQFSNVNFGNCSQGHLVSTGGRVSVFGNYTISGGAGAHIVLSERAEYQLYTAPVVITLSGTPAFTNNSVYASPAFAIVTDASFASIPSTVITFSGSATGKRYTIADVSLVDTVGGGASFLPGSSAGTVANSFNYQ